MRSPACKRTAFSTAAALAALTTLTTLTWSAATRADASGTKSCVDAYGAAQEHRKNDDLLRAREALWVCAAATCPTVIQGDCTNWLSQVVEAIPSVVFEATLDDENVFDVSVSMDGVRLVSQLDGKPIEINPGLHTFTFERKGSPRVDKKVIVAAHGKSQVFSAAWHSPPKKQPAVSLLAGAPAAGDAGMNRPTPAIVYVLGGVAVAGFATFAVLGLTANATQNDLQSSCSPHCAASDVDALKARFIVADVAAGIGALSAVGAATLFLTRPQRPAHAAAAIGLHPIGGGAELTYGGAF